MSIKKTFILLLMLPCLMNCHQQGKFIPLFNGVDLTGWKGLVGNPVTRRQMSPAELDSAQVKADSIMHAHWKVIDDMLVFDGQGFQNMCTQADYGDFELRVEWKIERDGDSGIYLRGSPQVQIWDANAHPEGSGGLYNNQQHPGKPLTCADKPVGEWNEFRVKMVNDQVTVHLNDVLVADRVIMENYWERDKPIYASGPIELQAHNSPLYFRRIVIKPL